MDNLCRKISDRKELIVKLREEISLLEEAAIKGIPSIKGDFQKKSKKCSPRESYEVERLINLLRIELEGNGS